MAIGGTGVSRTGAPRLQMSADDLLELVSNPDKYRKAMADLTKAKQEAQEAAEKLVKARNIDKYHAEAITAREEAHAVLAKAKKDAEDILASAALKSNEARKDLAGERDEFEAYRSSEKALLDRQRKELTSRLDSLAQKHADAENLQRTLDIQRAEVEAMRLEYTHNTQKLKEAMKWTSPNTS